MSLNIRVMTAADVPFGMALKEANGWNQLPADWERFLAMEPDGCFVAELDGRPVGTTCTCIFGDIAWIAMVLVDAQCRGRGIGTALMKHAMDYLEGKVSSIRLDATPLGRPVYEKLGFVAEYSLARYEGILPHRAAAQGVETVQPAQLDLLFRFDHSITGTDRRKMLRQFHSEKRDAMRWIVRGKQVEGFAYTRAGSRARFLGPILATAEAAPSLLADACHRHGGEYVYMDIPLANTAACGFAGEMGLKVQRQLLRMGTGPAVHENIGHFWASSGPEKG